MYIAELIEKIASEHNLPVELVEESTNSVSFLIEWGDWKHEHLYFNELVYEALEGISITENITEEDGSDCYSAIHRVEWD